MTYLILLAVIVISFTIYRYLVIHVLKQKDFNFFLDLAEVLVFFGGKDADDEFNKNKFKGVKGQVKELAFEWVLNLLLGIMIVSFIVLVLLIVSKIMRYF